VRGSLDLLRARGGKVSVRALAREIGVTERQLQRAYREQIGLAPKAMARIVRLHALLERLALAPVSSWAALAHESGFADQAHLNHEFKELTGSSPGAFVRGKRLSDFYNPTLGFDVNVQACSRDDGDATYQPATARRSL
jgi:AraC-like DNA-binding protein